MEPITIDSQLELKATVVVEFNDGSQFIKECPPFETITIDPATKQPTKVLASTISYTCEPKKANGEKIFGLQINRITRKCEVV